MLDPTVQARILAALNHEEGDRVPIEECIDNRAILDHICPGWTDLQAAMVTVYHTLGIDWCRAYGASYAESDDQAASEDGGERRVSGRTNWAVRHPIGTLDDLKAFRTELLDEAQIRNQLAEFRTTQRRFEPYTLFAPLGSCGFHATYALMGQQLFSYAIYDDPKNVERILEEQTENWFRWSKAVAKANLGPIYLIGDDIAYKGGLLFSPDFLRRTLLSSLRKVIEPVKAAGMKVIFHSDGYLMEILDELIDAGIDGLNPIEPVAGMDIGLLKRRYGKNLVLVGNVDCSHVLPFGSVDDIIKATKRCLSEAGHGGGLFVGSSSEIVPSTPVENIVAFYEACRTWGTYPLRV